MRRKRFIFKNHFLGAPKLADFELIEDELPALKEGEVLFEAMYLSVDPYMRTNIHEHDTGSTMFGQQVAKVVQSKNRGYNNGDLVSGYFGWTSHTVVKPETVVSPFPDKSKPTKLTPVHGQSPSVVLGALGMPGYTAYCGMVKILKPKTGEILVVTAAAGAVGSIAGQLAKNLDAVVIGFAGSDQKVKMLKNELKFDHAFNYKTANTGDVLKEVAPHGIDLFFDNVGGDLADDIMNTMKVHGRVLSCGRISQYNVERRRQSIPLIQNVVKSKLKMLSITHDVLTTCWEEGLGFIRTGIDEGKIIVKETVTQGFNNMPKAFIGLFTGQNTGKAIVKV